MQVVKIETLATRAAKLREHATGIRRGHWRKPHMPTTSESFDYWKGYADALEREASSLEGVVELARISDEATAIAKAEGRA